MIWRILRRLAALCLLLAVAVVYIRLTKSGFQDSINRQALTRRVITKNVEVQANDMTVAVPEFSIAVKPSDAARQKLQSLHESVLVIAYFDGDPLPGKGKDNSPMRGVVLGSDQKVVDANNVATFADTKISQSNWKNLSDKNYYVTINVVSARKSSKDNLLDCTDPIDRIGAFVGKSTQVFCRLIGEPASSQ